MVLAFREVEKPSGLAKIIMLRVNGALTMLPLKRITYL